MVNQTLIYCAKLSTVKCGGGVSLGLRHCLRAWAALPALNFKSLNMLKFKMMSFDMMHYALVQFIDNICPFSSFFLAARKLINCQPELG